MLVANRTDMKKFFKRVWSWSLPTKLGLLIGLIGLIWAGNHFYFQFHFGTGDNVLGGKITIDAYEKINLTNQEELIDYLKSKTPEAALIKPVLGCGRKADILAEQLKDILEKGGWKVGINGGLVVGHACGGININYHDKKSLNTITYLNDWFLNNKIKSEFSTGVFEVSLLYKRLQGASDLNERSHIKKLLENSPSVTIYIGIR